MGTGGGTREILGNKKPDSVESGLAVVLRVLLFSAALSERMTIVAKPTRASARV